MIPDDAFVSSPRRRKRRSSEHYLARRGDGALEQRPSCVEGHLEFSRRRARDEVTENQKRLATWLFEHYVKDARSTTATTARGLTL